MKQNRIARAIQILTALQAGKSCTVDDLASLFGTSRRTIFRDLEELQAAGVPYKYNPRSHSYAIDPEFFLPPIDLNLQEALSLLLLVHRTSRHIQQPLKSSALMAALKIENNLPIKIRTHCATALKNISTKTGAQATMSFLDGLFTQLQKAITKRRRVSLCYYSLFEGRIINLDLCPYHLMYNHRAWYVLGFSDIYKSVRTFKLNRIRELKVSDKGFIGGEDFCLEDYLGNAWSMIPEGRIYDIKLRFLPKVAENVAEVQWHNTQKTCRNPDGSVTIEFRIDGLNEITWWILGYGDQVQILAPKALRNKVLQIARNVVSLGENT